MSRPPTSIATFADHAGDGHVGNAAKPRCQHDNRRIARPPRMSPTPGMKPTMPSSPKRIDVPGMRNQSSSTCESRSRFSSSKSFAGHAEGFSRQLRCGFRISGLALLDRCHTFSSSNVSNMPNKMQFPQKSADATRQDTAAIVQWQNAALWQRMSWVRNPLAAPIFSIPAPPLNRRRCGARTKLQYLTDFLCPAPRKLSRQSSLAALSAAKLPHVCFVGTSGWAYPTWKPEFYPESLARRSFCPFMRRR